MQVNQESTQVGTYHIFGEGNFKFAQKQNEGTRSNEKQNFLKVANRVSVIGDHRKGACKSREVLQPWGSYAWVALN